MINNDNWISVKDKLPKSDEIVLVSLADSDVTFAVYKRTIYSLNNYKYSWVGMVSGNRRGFDKDEEVTHWMPLPNPFNNAE